METVAITAHRGSSARAPENTLGALHQAARDGADFAEIDVQSTADGAVVLLHDADLSRVAGDPRRVRDLTLHQLQTLDVGKWFGARFVGERIPTLDDVIHFARDRIQLNIELKYHGPDPALAGRVIETLRRNVFLDRSIITSTELSALEEIRHLAPDVRTGPILRRPTMMLDRLPGGIVSIHHSAASRRFIHQARRIGKEVHVWTVNATDAIRTMFDRGVHNLITDHPEVAVRLRRERALIIRRRQS